ncbi:MAG: hypothetical protein J5J00_17335 [Deltaproteobacteria bacterium]|nr:hypothetical protein [Deltaproteobacteria bacterium]
MKSIENTGGLRRAATSQNDPVRNNGEVPSSLDAAMPEVKAARLSPKALEFSPNAIGCVLEDYGLRLSGRSGYSQKLAGAAAKMIKTSDRQPPAASFSFTKPQQIEIRFGDGSQPEDFIVSYSITAVTIGVIGKSLVVDGFKLDSGDWLNGPDIFPNPRNN